MYEQRLGNSEIRNPNDVKIALNRDQSENVFIGKNTIDSIQIYNTNGQQVQSDKVNNNSGSISSLQKPQMDQQ